MEVKTKESDQKISCFFQRQEINIGDNIFWIDLQQNYQQIQDHFYYLSEDLLYSGYLLQKVDNQYVENFYKLYKDRIIQYNDQKVLVMFFQSVKLEAIDFNDENENKELQTPNNSQKFLFYFYYEGSDSTQLYARKEEEFLIWYEHLKKCCIQGYFNRFYKNIKVVGKGSFAKVIHSLRIADNYEFAVKTFNKFKLLSPQNKNCKYNQQTIHKQDSLIKEINILKLIHHPNIIQLHEVYEGEYHIYLVMELLQGGELFERVIKKGHYTEEDSCKLIKQLLRAIEHLHSMGIMHRDIKPENLIFKDENSYELKLADFGLSEYKNHKNPLFKRCGTPGYVAPELLKDEEYDEKVDIFSAGVILYILLTGCTPFFGESYNEIIMKNQEAIVNYNFNDIDIYVSDEAQDLLQQLLEVNPQKRCSASAALQHEWIQKFAPDDKILCSPTLKKIKQKNQVQNNLTNTIKQHMKQKELHRPSNIIISSPLINGHNVEIQDNEECVSPLIKYNMKVLKKSESYNKMKMFIENFIKEQNSESPESESDKKKQGVVLTLPSQLKDKSDNGIINLVKIKNASTDEK